MDTHSTRVLSPTEARIRWGGLALLAGAVAAAALGVPGAGVLAPWLSVLGLGGFATMSVLAGMRETRRRRKLRA